MFDLLRSIRGLWPAAGKVCALGLERPEQFAPNDQERLSGVGFGLNIRQGMPDSLTTTRQGTWRDLKPMARQA